MQKNCASFLWEGDVSLLRLLLLLLLSMVKCQLKGQFNHSSSPLLCSELLIPLMCCAKLGFRKNWGSSNVLRFWAFLDNRESIDDSIEGSIIDSSKRVAFPLVKNYVTNTWSKFGFQNVIKDDDDVYYFKFTSLNGLEQVLEQGPWLIQYEWKPPRCSECLVFGHDTSECPKRVVEPTKESTEAGDGFTMVQNRKKKGKSVVNGQIRHADGFRPSKPKPKYAWSVKQNQNNNAEIKVTDEEFTMKLKNHFSALHDDNVVVPSKVTGASSSGVFNDGDPEKLIPTSLDTDSEVEDLGNEYDVVKTSKGASTPSDEFPNV
ncbi:hypothetical protein Tco_0361112 [Tanacetum coccineum]